MMPQDTNICLCTRHPKVSATSETFWVLFFPIKHSGDQYSEYYLAQSPSFIKYLPREASITSEHKKSHPYINLRKISNPNC